MSPLLRIKQPLHQSVHYEHQNFSVEFSIEVNSLPSASILRNSTLCVNYMKSINCYPLASLWPPRLVERTYIMLFNLQLGQWSLGLDLQTPSGSPITQDRIDFSVIQTPSSKSVYLNQSVLMFPLANVRFLLKELIVKFSIKSVLDVECGDLAWISRLFEQPMELEYIGVDRSKEVINNHLNRIRELQSTRTNISLEHSVDVMEDLSLSAAVAAEGVMPHAMAPIDNIFRNSSGNIIMEFDFIEESIAKHIPDVDLIVMKHSLSAAPTEVLFKILKNFKESGAHFLLLPAPVISNGGDDLFDIFYSYFGPPLRLDLMDDTDPHTPPEPYTDIAATWYWCLWRLVNDE